MKIGKKTINPVLEVLCLLSAVAMVFGFHGIGRIFSGQGNLGLVPLLFGIVGIGFGFWIWYQADRITERKTAVVAVPLAISVCLVFSLFIGALTRGALLNLGASQVSSSAICGLAIMMGVGLGLRVKFLLLKI